MRKARNFRCLFNSRFVNVANECEICIDSCNQTLDLTIALFWCSVLGTLFQIFRKWQRDSFFLGQRKLCSTTTSSFLSNGCSTSTSSVVTSSDHSTLVLVLDQWDHLLFFFNRTWNAFCCWDHQPWLWRVSEALLRTGGDSYPRSRRVSTII